MGVVDVEHLISAVTLNLDRYLVLMETRALMVLSRLLGTQKNHNVSGLQVGKLEL